MTDAEFPGVENDEDGGVLRPSLMAAFLILVGLNLWAWNENREQNTPNPSLVMVTDQR